MGSNSLESVGDYEPRHVLYTIRDLTRQRLPDIMDFRVTALKFLLGFYTVEKSCKRATFLFLPLLEQCLISKSNTSSTRLLAPCAKPRIFHMLLCNNLTDLLFDHTVLHRQLGTMPTYFIIPSPQPPYLDPPNENLHITESSKLIDGVNGPVGNVKYTKVILHALKGVPGADAALPDGYPHILDYTLFFQFIAAGVIVAEPENLRDPANTFNLPPADVIAMVIYLYLKSHGTNLQWDCNDSDYAAFAIRLFGEDYPCWKYRADDIDGNGEYAEIKRDFGDITVSGSLFMHPTYLHSPNLPSTLPVSESLLLTIYRVYFFFFSLSISNHHFC